MRSKDLDHVLRAVEDVTQVEHSFLLIGSQAILAHIDPDYFPELEDCDMLFVSAEIDVAVICEEEDTQERVADLIDGALGSLSHFDQTHGYHADGVQLGTAILADGWRDRLKPYKGQGLAEGKFFALSYEDLAVSKIMAGREKDIEFVMGMCRAQPHNPRLQDVEELLLSLEPGDARERALILWRAMVPARPPPPHGSTRPAA